MRSSSPPSALAALALLLLLVAWSAPAAREADALPHVRARILELKREHQCGSADAAPAPAPRARRAERDGAVGRPEVGRSGPADGGPARGAERPRPSAERTLLEAKLEATMVAFDASLLPGDAALVASLPDDMAAVAASVREDVREAWAAYRANAWGRDELVTRGCKWANPYAGQGVTIVDSLSTLLLLGLDEEYEEAADWVKDTLDYDGLLPSNISTFETSIRSLGGLMSAYESTRTSAARPRRRRVGNHARPDARAAVPRGGRT